MHLWSGRTVPPTKRGKSENSPEIKSFSRLSSIEGGGSIKIFGGGILKWTASLKAQMAMVGEMAVSFCNKSTRGEILFFPMNQKIHLISSESPRSTD